MNRKTMRDFLLEKICNLENWLSASGKRFRNWPLSILILFVLVVALMLSNLLAVGSLLFSVFSKQKELNNDSIIELETEEQLKQVIGNSQFVLVDFWAAWCGPCVMMKPALHAVADQFTGRLIIVMVDTSAFADLAKNYSVAGLPSLLFFENGELVDRHAGALSEVHLSELVREKFDGL